MGSPAVTGEVVFRLPCFREGAYQDGCFSMVVYVFRRVVQGCGIGWLEAPGKPVLGFPRHGSCVGWVCPGGSCICGVIWGCMAGYVVY